MKLKLFISTIAYVSTALVFSFFGQSSFADSRKKSVAQLDPADLWLLENDRPKHNKEQILENAMRRLNQSQLDEESKRIAKANLTKLSTIQTTDLQLTAFNLLFNWVPTRTALNSEKTLQFILAVSNETQLEALRKFIEADQKEKVSESLWKLFLEIKNDIQLKAILLLIEQQEYSRSPDDYVLALGQALLFSSQNALGELINYVHINKSKFPGSTLLEELRTKATIPQPHSSHCNGLIPAQ